MVSLVSDFSIACRKLISAAGQESCLGVRRLIAAFDSFHSLSARSTAHKGGISTNQSGDESHALKVNSRNRHNR